VTDQANTIDDHGMLVKSQILREEPPPVFVEWPGQNLARRTSRPARSGTSRTCGRTTVGRTCSSRVRGAPSQLDGAYYGIPIDIHRMNNLFYHVDLAEEYGVDPTRVDSPSEFLEVLAACDDGDLIGMEQPMKNPSDVLQNNLRISSSASSAPRRTRGSRRARLAGTRANSARPSNCSTPTPTWLAGRHLRRHGPGQRAIHGPRVGVFPTRATGWPGSYEDQADFDYGVDWDHAVFPGTEGVFMLSTDALVAAEHADFGEDTRAFLEFMASPPAQQTLNRIKGSIPPREDVDISGYPPDPPRAVPGLQIGESLPRRPRPPDHPGCVRRGENRRLGVRDDARRRADDPGVPRGLRVATAGAPCSVSEAADAGADRQRGNTLRGRPRVRAMTETRESYATTAAVFVGSLILFGPLTFAIFVGAATILTDFAGLPP